MNDRPGVWRMLLYTQWKWTRAIVLLVSLVGFALPMLSFRFAIVAAAGSPLNPRVTFVNMMQSWGVGYAVTAAGLGLMVALSAWANDHRLRHVYALALPITRWRYVLHRFTAGLVLLAIPVAIIFLSAELVAHNALVPQGLNAYPVALTLRFAFATIVGYSVFFAISAATPRTAGFILGAIALVVVAQIMFTAAGASIDVQSRALDVLLAAPGLLAVFGGRWSLIDV